MNIPLPQPVPVQETVVTTTSRESATVDFILASFTEGRVTVKVQPWNREITIEGAAYEAMRTSFEGALTQALAPAIAAALVPAEEAP